MKLREAILIGALAASPSGITSSATNEELPNPSLRFCRSLEKHAGNPKILEAEYGHWNPGRPTYVALTVGHRIKLALEDGLIVEAECSRHVDVYAKARTSNPAELVEPLKAKFERKLPKTTDDLACLKMEEAVSDFPGRSVIYADCKAGAMEEDDGESESTRFDESNDEEAYIDPADEVDGAVDNVIDMRLGDDGVPEEVSSWDDIPPSKKQAAAAQRRFETLLRQAGNKLK
ncbi:hypothetical protein HZA42_05065 [Candidatus Peregrinibacteria bacterium]|nr:hypothetical protein [Candidatus Peregrinibacteria bacterium]